MAEANIPLVAKIMVQHGGASGSSGTSTDRNARKQAGDTRQIQKNTQATSKSSRMGLVKMIGLLTGVGLVLGFVVKLFKNSQVTKSIFGSLFQILGAMVDVFLAPFVPYIIPVLHALADKVDDVAAWSENTVQQLRDKIGPWFRDLTNYIVAGDFRGMMKHIIGGIGALVYKALNEVPILKSILSYLVTASKLLGTLITFQVAEKVSGGALNPLSGLIGAGAAGTFLAATWSTQDTKNLGTAIGAAINIQNNVNVDKDGNVQEDTEVKQNSLSNPFSMIHTNPFVGKDLANGIGELSQLLGR